MIANNDNELWFPCDLTKAGTRLPRHRPWDHGTSRRHRPASLPGSSSAAVLLALLLVALAGCAHRPHRPAFPPGYDLPGEPWREIDTTPLRGRRIVLDPGHGGFFRGAIGRDGLAEADVNLGVALYLRGLLEWAGAEVHLTRSVDRDFLTPADSSLAADLAARVALVDSLRPDVFVSLHHNSNPRLDRSLNETQTYYPAGRDGADLDLARAIQRRLVRNLGITPARILPGNFYVLRHSTCPAVLGEPAMLSNPAVERRLSLAEKQQLEARAYFLGLLDYFRGGTPAWSPPRIAERDGRRSVRWAYLPGGRPGAGGPALDPTSVELRIDGVPVSPAIDPADGTVVWHPGDAVSRRPHVAVLRGCNLAGRATPVRRDTIRPSRERFRFAVARDGTGRRRLEWRSDGSPLESFASLVLASPAAADWRLTLPPGRGARGSMVLPAGTPDPLPPLRLLWRRVDGAAGEETPACDVDRDDLAGHRWTTLVAADPWPAAAVPGGVWHDFSSRLAGGLPLPAVARDATVVPLPVDRPVWLQSAGARPLLWPPDGVPATAVTAAAAPPPDTLRWEPLVPSLAGLTVVVDPSGGGREDQGRDLVGRSGSGLNLALARCLAAFLRGAGATVVMTREDDRLVADQTKVLLADAVGADLYLGLARAGEDGPAWRVLHHPGSTRGEAWARALAAALPVTGVTDTVGVDAAYDYLLRQTACPAVVVVLPRPGAAGGPPETEELLVCWQRCLASALLTGTALRDGGSPAAAAAATDSLLRAVATAGETPDWLLVDGNWLWTPPPSGTGWRACLPLRGRRHLCEVHRDDRWELLLVDRSASDTWRAHPLAVRSPGGVAAAGGDSQWRWTVGRRQRAVFPPATTAAVAGGFWRARPRPWA